MKLVCAAARGHVSPLPLGLVYGFGGLLPFGALFGPQVHDVVVEPVDLDAAALVLHLRDHLREDEAWVRERAAKRPGVKVGVASAEIDLRVDEAAQAVAD